MSLKLCCVIEHEPLLTVSGTAVAMFVFCLVGSVQEGLERLTTGSDADRSLIVFQENRFLPNQQSVAGRLRARDSKALWCQGCNANSGLDQ